MKNAPGYPLPSGELGNDDLVCQLVYLPDRPEYWQAFYSALHYMTTWRAWERDDDKRGKLAAANWRDAFELTSECWRMTCLEQLQNDVAAILAIMEMPQSCCDDMDITDGDQYTDRIQDGEGDVPQNIIDAGYAEDAADWEGFDDYKCMIAHVAVNQLSARLNELGPIVNSYGAVFGGLAALAGIASVIFSGGGTAIVFGLLMGVGSVALLYEALISGDLLLVLADKVDTNHDELSCAIYNSDGDSQALAFLNDKIDELFTGPEALILKNFNNGPTLKALYNGRYDQQDIADQLLDAGYELGNFNCECQGIGEYQTLTEFGDGDSEHWEVYNSYIHNNGMDGGWAWGKDINDDGSIWHSVATMQDTEGITRTPGSSILIHGVKFWYKMTDYYAGHTVKLKNTHNGGLETKEWGHQIDWTEVEETFDPPLETDYNGAGVVTITSAGLGYHLYVDRITIDWDYIPPA